MKKYFILPYLAALMALVWGCSNEQLMGGDLTPSSDKSIICLVDTITINAFTELEDTVYTGGPSFFTVGTLNDPIFGTTKASFATKFSNTSYSLFYSTSICDSIRLSLGLDTTLRRFYGDSLALVTMNVYRLNDSLQKNKRYYQNYDISAILDPNPIGTATFSPARADSMVSVLLDKSYGDLVINSTLDTTFDANCGGLYFTIEAKNTLVRFSSTSLFTEYTLYHHKIGDTVKYNATFSVASANPRVQLFSHDYSETSFISNVNNKQKDTSLYLQSGVGTKIRIEMPYINKLVNLNDGKYATITNARLLLPLGDSITFQEKWYPTLSGVSMFAKSNTSGLEFFPADFCKTSVDNYYQSYYSILSYGLDYKKRQYSVDFTGMVKTMLENVNKGNANDFVFYLSSSGRVTDFSRSVINSPTHATRPMKMVVEYISYEK